MTNAALSVQSNLKRVEAAVAARELAEKRLEAEQSKFEVGMTTNFFVVQAQRDLRDAQNSELRALADYRKSLVTFERVAGSAGRRRWRRWQRRDAATGNERPNGAAQYGFARAISRQSRTSQVRVPRTDYA